MDQNIKWDGDVPKSQYCSVNTDGTLDLRYREGGLYQLAIADVDTAEAMARTILHLAEKRWFTPEIQADLVIFLSLLRGLPGRWAGWVRSSAGG